MEIGGFLKEGTSKLQFVRGLRESIAKGLPGRGDSMALGQRRDSVGCQGLCAEKQLELGVEEGEERDVARAISDPAQGA